MSYPAIRRNGLFRDGHMSIGLVLPIRASDTAEVDFREQMELASLADRLGFAAVWVRDVPLNGSWYPEPFGHPDPFIMLGAIVASTSRISIGTAATVLTLRHPLHIAKAAITLDRLAPGRLVLGLGSGDRREEFAAFGADTRDHKELYRSHWMELAAALERPPRILRQSSDASVTLELRPPAQDAVPMLAIGSSGQTLDWIARNSAGWTTYHRPPDVQRDRYALWRRAVDQSAAGAFRSFSVALRVELLDDENAPVEEIELGYRTGARRLLSIFEALRESGVHHLLLNIVPNGRPAERGLQAIAAEILPHFS